MFLYLNKRSKFRNITQKQTDATSLRETFGSLKIFKDKEVIQTAFEKCL
jgi:hypothetical protein